MFVIWFDIIIIVTYQSLKHRINTIYIQIYTDVYASIVLYTNKI